MRKSIRLDGGWRFHLGDAADAFYMGYDDRGWRQVTVPHDWAVEHPFDPCWASGTGYLPGGIGWYRGRFNLPEEDAGRRVRITFEGVYKRARVWINSNYLGRHAYGYTSFSMDLSGYVRPGENVIAVRVDHSEAADSRWYTGSGIDRPVILTVTDPVCFREHGIYAVTEETEEDGLRIRIRYETEGAEEARFRLLTPEGNTAAEGSARGETGGLILAPASPRRWSTEDPFLYTLEGETLKNGQATDRTAIPFGLRTFRFDPDKGFFLNGKNMKLKGVCVHHDGGCLGAAVPKTVWRTRLEKLKEMGCNAVRTAHNPPDPALLDLCDEMGFLVMDEAFDEWEGVKNKWWQGHNVYPPKHYGYGEDFPEWHREDLRSMVERDRNHPCVILWSIGNEIDYPNDPYVTPLFREALGNNDANKPLAERIYDARKPDAGRLAKVAEELTGLVHELDGSRPVTSALSFPELSNRTGYADALDIAGYNYRERFYDEDHRKYPGRVILGSENGHEAVHWQEVTDREYMAGQFLWTGVDFLGECPGWPKRISQAGALDLRGKEKAIYAQRKALWTEKPVIRIAVGPGGEEDRGPWGEAFRWQGIPGEKKRISCYTNGKAAELFLNGRSLGRKELAAEDGCRAVWLAEYEEGILEARTDGAADFLATPGEAESLRLVRVNTEDPAPDAVQLEALLLDRQGNPAMDGILHCQALGDVRILGLENGLPDDLTPYAETFRTTREGSLTIYLSPGGKRDSARIHVYTDSGLTADLEL